MSLDQELAIDRATELLKMPGLRKVFREKAREATETGLSPLGYLEGCLEAEISNRKENETRRRLQEARFPVVKTLETFDFRALPSLSREKIRALSEGKAWRERENVLLVGQVGTGKPTSPSLWVLKRSSPGPGSDLSPPRL